MNFNSSEDPSDDYCMFCDQEISNCYNCNYMEEDNYLVCNDCQENFFIDVEDGHCVEDPCHEYDEND